MDACGTVGSGARTVDKLLLRLERNLADSSDVQGDQLLLLHLRIHAANDNERETELVVSHRDDER